ncbi:hypothetical protein FRC12_018076 [Ceratobasidium sp. 428]|nr:hypothetical protein FRC12_018076 [Ceratobasidium sp. 428]
MTEKNKRSLKHDSGPVFKRFKLFSSSSVDPGRSAQSTQQANTTLTPETVLPSPPITQQSTKREGWTELKALVSTLSKGFNSFGPLKQAVEGIIAGIETFEHDQTASQNRADYENLRNELNGLFHDLVEFFDASTPPIMAPSIINFARGIDRELEIVRRRLSETRTVTHSTDADEILEHYRRIQALLQRLTSNIGFKTLRIADEQATEVRLKSLPHSPAAKYNSAESFDLRGQCTQNTRVRVLESLYEWACNDMSQKIYWLNGMAGTGKTTIAYSFCEQLELSRMLAASFFCSRQLPACRDVNQIVPTVSYQLSRFSRPFRSAISRVLEEDPDVNNQPLLDQLKSLILRPFGQEKNTLPTDLVVVIDALDECENKDGVDQILSTLLSCAQELPVKFFVASRPDAKILDRMRGQHGENASTELRLHELDRPTVQEDIKTYLTMKLKSHMNLSVANLDVLAKQSGVLFIYASTVTRYLESDNFSRADGRLKEILSASKDTSDNSQKHINSLYSAILKGAFDNSHLTRQDWDEMRLVLDTVVCSKEPLSIDTMASLLGFGAKNVRAALRPLFSVLHLSDTDQIITTLHESFPDYLLDKTRSEVFCCDATKHNAQLARLCFEQIKVPSPPFNICNLESAYVLDKDVQDLPARVEKAISRQLLYACRYWIAHYLLAEQSRDLANMLREFASERFLIWIEVMNLSGCLHEGIKALYDMRKWSMSADYVDEGMRRFLQDMCDFATSFSSTPAALSTPHLYVSTLTFWRDQTPIAKHYGRQRIRLITEQSTAISRRRPAALAVLYEEQAICYVAYSPDGAYILSCLISRGTIRIWDAHTGQPVGQPLEGHTERVNSAAYSPDGAYIVSGSDDYTIRIWDAQTNRPVGQPLKGHDGSVNSVAYSPDGAYIVSGSEDMTIRIWDAHNGRLVRQLSKKHTKPIQSVAYSPDDTYILSGSDDGVVCIWDAHTGQLVKQPFKDSPAGSFYSVLYSPDGAYAVCDFGYIRDIHTVQEVRWPRLERDVKSVAHSPDGARLIFGDYDNIIRIWDTHTSQPVGQPLEGHTDIVNSIVYSPDSAYILSGSYDHTIRIWDAHTGQSVGQSSEGHTGFVNSVAYSPDGAYIVSGSEDMTIRIWDAHNGHLVRRLSKKHTKPVQCVAYSPDGTYIASGSEDSTLRIWNAHTGQPVGSPIFASVSSLAYSPDGACIISGSRDGTIHIWDTHTGQSVGQPLKGHAANVNSVAYSPDGAYIASGSLDGTIRIWGVQTRQPVGRPLKGHTSYVNSVAYSPDGTYISSGSDDKTIRIWNAHTGQSVGAPLKGHTSFVNSVAYSPDGACVASGSFDGTIRIWDAQTGRPVGQPLRGHISSVKSIAYSPNGAHIISGSRDEDVRIWDMHSITSRAPHRPRDTTAQTAHPSHVAPKLGITEERLLCNIGCRVDCPHMAWTLDKDGWIVFRSDKLIWVPLDLRETLLRPQNTALIVLPPQAVGPARLFPRD